MFEGLSTTDFGKPTHFLLLTCIFFGAVFLRYLFVSGVFHYVFYVLLRKQYQHRILNGDPKNKIQIKKEIIWSAITSFIFGVSGTIMIMLWQQDLTAIYLDLDQYALWYLPVSLLVVLFLHETYYYWLHRWMHLPKVYQLMHKVHHDSIHTNSLTAFSFHPIESVAQAIIIPLIVFFVPIHVYVLLLVLLIMTFSGTLNHAGVELFPEGFHQHWLGKWLIGASHHDQHHKKFRYNFGLYFTFWDKWMGTETEDYEVKFNPERSLKS